MIISWQQRTAKYVFFSVVKKNDQPFPLFTFSISTITSRCSNDKASKDPGSIEGKGWKGMEISAKGKQKSSLQSEGFENEMTLSE